MGAGDALSPHDVPLRADIHGEISVKRKRVRAICRLVRIIGRSRDFSISVSARIPVPLRLWRYDGLVFRGVGASWWGRASRTAQQHAEARRRRG